MNITFFLSFWFCAICESIKSCLILKIIPPKTISKILSFEGKRFHISKIEKTRAKSNVSFFPPHGMVLIIASFLQFFSVLDPTFLHFFFSLYA